MVFIVCVSDEYSFLFRTFFLLVVPLEVAFLDL